MGDHGSGENSIVVVLGANEAVTAADAKAAEEIICNAKVLCCQLEVPTEATLEALRAARGASVVTLFNAAPMLPDLDPRLLTFTDILCVNENEAEILTKRSLKTVEDAKMTAKDILKMGPPVVIITLGAKGCVFLDATMSGADHIDCPKVQAVDTTGAGDSFVGSFAYFTAKLPTLSLRERIRRSSIIASRSVMKPGTQSSYPSKDDLDARLFTE